LAAVGALPGNTVAGHPPKVFQHAFLTDLKAATALPAEGEDTGAADALIGFCRFFIFSL